MAFRIHECVVRGEIDNRVKGIVRGRIWLADWAEPMVLELKGNAWADLAGCLLTFKNRNAPIKDRDQDVLDPLQKGTIGDITASRKVRVFDIPVDEAYMMAKRGEKPPEHMANSLYLEWFSDSNGRVVIESADYEMEMSAPEWRMTQQEEEERRAEAAVGLSEFMARLTEAVEQHKRGQKDPEEEWDEHDYEKFLKAADATTEKYGELLDKFGDSEDADEKIAEEMGWTRRDGEEAEAEAFVVEELDDEDIEMPEPDPATEGIDWIRRDDGEIVHPLQFRCRESSFKFYKIAEQHGLETSGETDLEDFIFEFQSTGAKLAGALNSLAFTGACDGAFIVAYLKRALDRLHKAQAGLEGVAKKNLLPAEVVEDARTELFGIREEILKLMDRYRGRSSE